MRTPGLRSSHQGELEVLNSKLAHAARDYSEELASIRNDERSKYEAATRAQIAALESKHAVETAQKNADLQAAAKEIEFQANQIKYLQQQIADERSTRLQVAQAEAGKQGVIVNAGK